MQPKRIDVQMLSNGDQVRWTLDDPVVTILKVKSDRKGYDVLYQHNGSEPRWRGFDDGDTVYLVATAARVRNFQRGALDARLESLTPFTSLSREGDAAGVPVLLPAVPARGWPSADMLLRLVRCHVPTFHGDAIPRSVLKLPGEET